MRKTITLIIVVATLLFGSAKVSAATYNRSNAVDYADTWAHDRNDGYPDYFPNYGTGYDCNDCTNYVSQVFYKGGVPEIDYPLGEDSVFTWWWEHDVFHGTFNSKTWSATDWLNSHASQYQGSRYEYKSSVTSLLDGSSHQSFRWP